MNRVMVSPAAGTRLRSALAQEQPLQVVGAVTAYCALLAERAGFRALYLSGGGVAASSCGLPDLGITTLADVLTDIRRITDACELPLLVDADVGWGGAFNIARAVKSIAGAGAAGLHLEDQVLAKRCGHRPNKAIVPQAEMVDRIKASADAKPDSDFVIMARTDALAVEGLQAAIDRACACVEAGADMVFPEAVTELGQYQAFVEATQVPVLANLTEFGHTPLFTLEELASVQVSLALYPVTAFRAMSQAALHTYTQLRKQGTQRELLDRMQTRAELYDILNYHAYEDKLDELFSKDKDR